MSWLKLNLMNGDEDILLLRLKSGDKGAFDQLFNRYAPRLGYFCLRLISRVDAEEVVQETFLRLWETRDKVDVALNFNTYITTIAKNLIYDMFRRKLVEQRYYQKIQPILQEQLTVENELYKANLQEVMLDRINKLSVQQREVMMLKSKGFNNDEIAGLLGISKRTVETHLNKAYKKLRNDLSEMRYYLLFFAFILNH